MSIFALLAAIMHLGNVQIVNERTNESCFVEVCFINVVMIGGL